MNHLILSAVVTFDINPDHLLDRNLIVDILLSVISFQYFGYFIKFSLSKLLFNFLQKPDDKCTIGCLSQAGKLSQLASN